MDNERFYIWNYERHQWWMPNSRGYTPNRKDAGEYTLRQAIEICADANKALGSYANRPQDAMIPVNHK